MNTAVNSHTCTLGRPCIGLGVTLGTGLRVASGAGALISMLIGTRWVLPLEYKRDR
jgi:hypothetical protein